MTAVSGMQYQPGQARGVRRSGDEVTIPRPPLLSHDD